MCGVGSVALEGPGPSLPPWCTPGLTGHPQAEATSLCIRGALLDSI